VERFEALVESMCARPGITPPGSGSGFGSSALRVNGKIFAMYVRDQLVVKLPAARVSALVAAGEGEHFDANKGTPMKEWLALSPTSGLDWTSLAEEALTFVGR
jgi:TfoX/Sxy family transcriptional regulator of competence genes